MFIFNEIYFKLKIIEMDDIVRDPILLAAARKLTIGPPSGMNSALDYFIELSKTRSVDALGIFAYYMQQPIGWSLFSYESDRYMFASREGNACAQVYVAHEYRRHGVGSRLLKQVAKIAHPDTVNVYRWSNIEFFDPIMQQI